MELRYGLWQGVSALFSEGGRQLGEENTRPFVLNHHLPAETIACKYDGSRAGRAINISALRIAMTNYDAALAITAAVREFHRGKMARNDAIGIWDLYVMAKASIALIAFQKRYAHQTEVSQTVSDALASQYQFISGIFMICRHMMDSGNEAIAQNTVLSAKELYDYADKNGIFISFNGMACAGSTAKILHFIEFCNEGGGSSAEASACELDSIVSEPAAWYDYALASMELDCFIALERLRRSDAANQTSAQIYRSVQDYCCNLATDFPDFGDWSDLGDQNTFESGVLARQNYILATLGRPQIGKLSSKHLAGRSAS